MDENQMGGVQVDTAEYAADLKAAEVPQLVFGAEPEFAPAEEVKPVEAKPVQSAAQAIVNNDILTEAEKKAVQQLQKQINISDTNAILQYGVGTQKKMSEFSDAALQTVRTRDLGEVGDMLTGVISNLETFNTEDKNEGGFFGLFKKPKKKIIEMQAEYDKANNNVERVAKALQAHQVTLMKDIATLDKMYASNLGYYKELTMYILAGKAKIEEIANTELAAKRAKAEKSGLSEDAQAVKDLEDQINRFEKKIHDLELTRMIAIQTAPQIRLIQSSDTMMVEKIQSTLVNTIPLWKNQMVLALGIEDSTKAARAEAAVTEMTNKLLTANAEKLKQATIETAQASERGIVDMETLRKTNESLISTLDEVARIQSEGREKRAAAETELLQLEKDLKEKLLNMKR
ncbi:MAG: toxic anion resistance protein [Eubacteriales bacterium]